MFGILIQNIIKLGGPHIMSAPSGVCSSSIINDQATGQKSLKVSIYGLDATDVV